MSAHELYQLPDYIPLGSSQGLLTNGQPIPQDDDPPENSWQPINLNTLPDQPPVQPDLAGIGLIYPGKRHVFSGPQESAKTLAAYLIGIQNARTGGRTLIIDFEMGAWDARQRLHDLGATTDDLNQILYIEPHTPAGIDTFPELLQHQPNLVIVDAAAGAYDIQGLDDNKRQDVERLSRLYINTFWRAGIATIMLDHVVKNTDQRGKYAIGSERKIGGTDVHLGFDTILPIKRGQAGLYKITTHKDRGGYLQRGKLADLHLDSHPETHQITWQLTPAEPADDSDTFEPTYLMERVSRYLEHYPGHASRKTVETNVQGKGDYIRKALDALIRHGHVVETEGPRGARLVSSSSPYREPDNTAYNEETDEDATTSSHLVPTSSRTRSPSTSNTGSPPQGGPGWDEVTRDEERGRPRPDPYDPNSDIPF